MRNDKKSGRLGLAGNREAIIKRDRESVAEAVGLTVAELISEEKKNPRTVLLRMVAAHLLLNKERLQEDVAAALNRSESAVRYFETVIQQRMKNYYAFRMYVEMTEASFALASA